MKKKDEIKRNHKDGIFRTLFHNEELLLDLYNAVSGSNYPQGTKIEIITLENVIFGDLKNDLAFIIDNKLIILIEHQSTVNPNMPVRMLCYIAKEYERLIFSRGVYSTRKIMIPTPEFYVFYNGVEEQPLEKELKLSDTYIEKRDIIPMELAVKVINVNYEKGAEILKRCEALEGYSRFIYVLRKQLEESDDKDAAIRESIEQCMKEGTLREFLKRKGGEIMSFLYEALTREECEAIREEDGYYRGLEEGEAKGIKLGEAKGRELGKAEEKKTIAANFKNAGIPIDVIAANTGLSEEDIEKL